MLPYRLKRQALHNTAILVPFSEAKNASQRQTVEA